jgi:phosphocarrier protein NPr/phosphocarrier protein
MIDTTIDVINKLGLHARASGKLIEVTKSFALRFKLGKVINWLMQKILCHC